MADRLIRAVPVTETATVAEWKAAAHHAPLAYPGPVGELVAREIRAWLEFAHRFGDGSLMRRVVADVLTRPVGTPTLKEDPVSDDRPDLVDNRGRRWLPADGGYRAEIPPNGPVRTRDLIERWHGPLREAPADLPSHAGQVAELIRTRHALSAAVNGLKGARRHLETQVEATLADVRNLVGFAGDTPQLGLVVDGDLLHQAVTEGLATDPLGDFIADHILDRLADEVLAAAVKAGFTVLRGTGSQPWTPVEEADHG